MRRNRKREYLRFGTVTKSLVACVCVAISGLGYVWQKNAIYRLGDEIKRREATLSSAQKRNTMLVVAPKGSQVVRLYEPGQEWDLQMANAPLPTQPQVWPRARSSQPKALAKR